MNELRSSLAFFKDSVVVGAVLFAYLLNLCFLAAQRDLSLERAYTRLAHSELYHRPELETALERIRQTGTSLHPADVTLIEQVRQGPLKLECVTLLQTKLALQSQDSRVLEKALLERLPAAESPLALRRLERFLLLYAWVVELAVLACLSQTLRNRQVQCQLHALLLKPYTFIPVATLFLLILLERYLELIDYRGLWTHALASLAALGCAYLLYRRSSLKLRPEQLPELGIYLLIASLFVQLAGILAGSDWALSLFCQPHMRYVHWGCRLIMLCFPLMVLEKAWEGQPSTKVITEPSQSTTQGA